MSAKLPGAAAIRAAAPGKLSCRKFFQGPITNPGDE
jgi:hypothetical protein